MGWQSPWCVTCAPASTGESSPNEDSAGDEEGRPEAEAEESTEPRSRKLACGHPRSQ
jgi:hypothetical protein